MQILKSNKNFSNITILEIILLLTMIICTRNTQQMPSDKTSEVRHPNILISTRVFLKETNFNLSALFLYSNNTHYV